eukprot:1181070-Prorocentrum_minimum.AAC.2
MATSAPIRHHWSYHKQSHQQSLSTTCKTTAAHAPSPARANVARPHIPAPHASARLPSAHSAAVPQRATWRSLSSSARVHYQSLQSLRSPLTVRWAAHGRDAPDGRPMCAILSDTSDTTGPRCAARSAGHRCRSFSELASRESA